MSSSTRRTLAVLELLQAHGQLSGREIARRLGVDPRSVRRYVVALEEMGIPVTAERGAGGGYALVAGFKLPPMLFTDDEALALSLGLLAASALGLGAAAAGLASARAKLERVMPADLKRRLRAADETMQLDLPAGGPPAAGHVLATLSAAAQAQRTVRLVYTAADRSRTARDLDPYGLAFRGGCWYVVGHCHLRRASRTFRVDRIATVSRTARTFERPREFDTLRAISTAIAPLPRAHRAEILLETDLATARAQIAATLGTLEAVEGGVLLSSQTDDLAWLARELARLPFTFRPKAPRELRAVLLRHLRAIRRAVLAEEAESPTAAP